MSTPKRGSSKDKSEAEELPAGAGAESTATTTSPQSGLTELGSPKPGGTSNGDFLGVVTRLMDMVEKERAHYLMSEESRRGAELRAADLQAEIKLEREVRRRAEAELEELKLSIEGRHRTGGGLDRLGSGDLMSRHEPGARRAPDPVESAAATPPSSLPDGRRAIVPEGVQGDSTGARASGPIVDDEGARVDESSTPDHFEANGGEATEEEPPLPPGWRYATELPPPKKRWGLWGKDD